MLQKGGDSEYKLTYKGSEASANRLVADNVVMKNFKDGGFEYTKGADWLGVVNPMMCFLSGHALRRRELRIGQARVVVGKTTIDDLEVPISEFGLSGVHTILLEGCTFPPEKRSSIAQIIGAITALTWMMKTPALYR